MKRLILGLIMLIPVYALADAETDKQAILATFDAWNEGWQQRDVVRALTHYADDVDWTNAFGDRYQSRAELEQGLSFIFGLDFVMAGSSETNAYTDIRFLSDAIAVVRSKLIRSNQETSEGVVMPARRINHLRVFEKRDGQWLIVSHLIAQEQDKR